MKFSLSWISEHIEFIPDITAEIIGNSLTNLGLEVESIHNPADKLKDFIIAEIIEVNSKPSFLYISIYFLHRLFAQNWAHLCCFLKLK